MDGIVDRIEGSLAVIETDGGMVNVPVIEGLQEGDCVTLEDGRIKRIDAEATRLRREKIEARLRRLTGGKS